MVCYIKRLIFFIIVYEWMNEWMKKNIWMIFIKNFVVNLIFVKMKKLKYMGIKL